MSEQAMGLTGSGRVLAIAMGLGGAILVIFGLYTIGSFILDSGAGALRIRWEPGGWAALPVGVSLLVLSAAIYLGRHEAGNPDGSRRPLLKRLLIVAAGALPFVVILPLAGEFVADNYLTGDGYQDCGDGSWARTLYDEKGGADLSTCLAFEN